ncbi:MAG: hypothetical protein ACYTGC_12430 [Planctomycetota bacterium]|jgi:hypothetical protein
MPEPRQSSAEAPDAPRHEDPLDAMAEELRALGGETETERAVKRTVPWVVSVMVHLGVILFAALLAGTVRLMQQADAPLIIADFHAMRFEPVAALEPVAMPVTPTVVPDQTVVDVSQEQIERELAELELETVALSDAASLAAPSTFTPRVTEGQVTFVGVSSTNARRIAYVIDASGSLISSLQVVIDEMRRSLQELTPRQEFSIIFFQQDRALVLPPEGSMRQGRHAEKVRALEWIDRNVIPNGNSNPLPALEAALRMKPDVIFLLSDNITGAGQYEIDQRELLARLDELNPRVGRSQRRRTRINCIQFLDPDPLDTLRVIAREHGGDDGFKFLDRAELGLARP